MFKFEKELHPVICYKTRTPIIYNAGTRYETNCDTFLAYYATNYETAQAECDKLNTEHPNKLWNGKDLDWNEIDYFFVDEQEAMGD